MASKALLIDEKAVPQEGNTIALATASLAGRDLCSIADLSLWRSLPSLNSRTPLRPRLLITAILWMRARW